METKFKSQICTTREQSERLLQLGLKKETADMCRDNDGWNEPHIVQTVYAWTQISDDYYPCWSLHRLIEMMPKSIYYGNLHCFLFIDQIVYIQYRCKLYGATQTIMKQFMKSNLWENLINCIEWLIKEGYFNKEYLV